MIIGSGLLARAFAAKFTASEEVCIYAAGVSDSGCGDALEFEREARRLAHSLRDARHCDAFVYFGTCSVADPEARDTPYVQHKLRMERLVSEHPRWLVLRLPQVAGQTPNPHTLLNYLHAKIARSEAFSVWSKARRNVIDVEDVAAIACELVGQPNLRQRTLNIANPVSYPIAEIVHAFELALRKKAICTPVPRGSAYPIDVTPIQPILHRLGHFDENYLHRVVARYYGR